MKTVLSATQNELARILWEPWILLIIIAAPLFYPFLYNSAYLARHETNVPAVICDLDRSATSREFIRKVDAHELSEVFAIVVSPDEARKMVEQGSVTGAFIIPHGFEQSLKSSERTTIRSWISNAVLMPASDLGKALGDCIASTNAESTVKFFSSRGFNSRRAVEFSKPIQVTLAEVANTTSSYGEFIIPAILILILQQSLAAGTAVSVSRDRRSHAHIDRPESTLVAIFGRVLPYVILFSIHASILFTVQFSIWKIPFSPNPLLFIPLVLFFIIASANYGMIIGSIFKNPLSALLAVMFTTYPIFLVSGYAWPKELLPPLFKFISDIVPTAPFLQITTGLGMLHGSAIDLLNPIVHLAILTGSSGIISLLILKSLWKESPQK